MTNWDRQYRLSAGPAGGTGFEIGETSPQQPTAMHINFSLSKNDSSTSNTGKVTVWNLSDAHIAVLNEKDCCVQLKAGYGKTMGLIFSGLVSFVCTEKDGADQKTTIEVTDSTVGIRDTYVSVSYADKINSRPIMDDIAAQMGLVPSYSYDAQFSDIQNGFSFVGLARDGLDKVCHTSNLTWSLQNGVLQIKKTGSTMTQEVYLLSPETGLIGMPKKVQISSSSSTNQQSVGWDVEFFLNPSINVDDYLRLESRYVTGFFRVSTIQISGDNISGDWVCSARLLEVGG